MKRQYLAVLIVLVLLGLVVAQAGAVVYYVSPDGSDSNSGFSWALAKKTIQAASDATASSGGEIWVKTGIYKGTLSVGPRAVLYGGFSGNETDRSQRNWVSNKTILEGDNQYASISFSSNSTTSVLDGFVIRNFPANAIQCSYSSPTISHNYFVGNRSAVNFLGSSAKFTNNVVAGNYGIAVNGMSPADQPVIYCQYAYSGLTIANNTLVGNGGGIFGSSSTPVISNNVIAYNVNGVKGSTSFTPSLKNNCVFGNATADCSGFTTNPIGVNGNISVDPKLVSSTYGDLRIQSGSPCIGAGDDTAGTSGVDFYGNTRLSGTHIDIGAHESTSSTISFSPSVYKVSTDGNDANDGLAWSAAKRTIQAAIDAASLTGGDIWVKKGHYNEKICIGAYTYLYGGFAGTETSLYDRNWTSNVTTIDGGSLGSTVIIRNAGYWLSTFDGFTVTGGTGEQVGVYNGGTNPRVTGGGILCYATCSTIANNHVTGNTAQCGGGIACVLGSPRVVGNTVDGNTADWDAGGILCVSGFPVIERNVISNNSARLYQGGGMHCSGTNAIIRFNKVYGNSITDSKCLGGGGINSEFSSDTIVGNLVYDNHSATNGGGIKISVYSSPISVINNTVVANTAVKDGGGLYADRYSAYWNNVIAYNSSGVYFPSGTTVPTMQANCIYGNTSYDYKGLTASASDINVDPLFVDRANGDYHLSVISPCVNKGGNSSPSLPSLDIDGEARLQGDTVDIGADECWLKAGSASDARRAANGVLVDIESFPVSAAFPNCFYIEGTDRSSGIRVDKLNHGLSAGMKADVSGVVRTGDDGERYIDAVAAHENGAETILPLGIGNGQLGGATFGPQAGVTTGGLNNIGLFVKVWGKITQIDPDGAYFYIDDGSRLEDGTKTGLNSNVGVRILADGRAYTGNPFVVVTGVSSCFKSDDGKLHRQVRVVSIQ